MRPLELLVAALGFFAALGLFVPRFNRRKALALHAPVAAVLAIVAHLSIEGDRWQMAPVYVLIVVLAGVALQRRLKSPGEDRSTRSGKRRRALSIVSAVCALLLLAAGVILTVIFPVVHLPAPTGPYAVGTTRIEFADSSRAETLTAAPHDIRVFQARVWYPAEITSGADRLPYLEYSAPVGSLAPGPPALVFRHLNLSRSNSFPDPPVLRREVAFPVVLFSVGFLAGYEDHQISMEELASHGYVVLSFTNPFESTSVVQDDGTIVPFTAEHAAAYQAHLDAIMPMWADFWATRDTAVRNDISRRMLASETFMDNALRIRVADIRFALDELERMNSPGSGSMFSETLDLSRLGVAGHSMGGAVAGQLCLVEPRVSAGVNLDGFQWGDVHLGTIRQPFLTAYSETFAGANDFVIGSFADTHYVLTIAGSTHMNFSDWPVVLPVTRRLGMAGPIEPARAAAIVNDYLLAFFDRHLRGAEAPLLAGAASPYPEVRMAVRMH